MQDVCVSKCVLGGARAKPAPRKEGSPVLAVTIQEAAQTSRSNPQTIPRQGVRQAFDTTGSNLHKRPRIRQLGVTFN